MRQVIAPRRQQARASNQSPIGRRVAESLRIDLRQRVGIEHADGTPSRRQHADRPSWPASQIQSLGADAWSSQSTMPVARPLSNRMFSRLVVTMHQTHAIARRNGGREPGGEPPAPRARGSRRFGLCEERDPVSDLGRERPLGFPPGEMGLPVESVISARSRAVWRQTASRTGGDAFEAFVRDPWDEGPTGQAAPSRYRASELIFGG